MLIVEKKLLCICEDNRVSVDKIGVIDPPEFVSTYEVDVRPLDV